MIELKDAQEQRERIRGILAQMRDILRRSETPSEADVAALEGRYAEEVRRVNDAFKVCAKLLINGEITQAHQRAREGDLPSLANMLDFPEREGWLSVLDMVGGSPETNGLDAEVAREVNSSFLAEERLAPHLQRLRWMALSQSPLRDRIPEMRRVRNVLLASRMDTVQWEHDIQTFEGERHKELSEELVELNSRSALPALHQLCQELDSKQWLRSPPKRLLEHARQSLQRARRIHARRRMKVLAASLCELHQTRGSDILDRGEKLLNEWERLSPIAKLADDDETVELATGALQFIRNELSQRNRMSDFHAHVERLKDFRDNGGELSEIERVKHALDSVVHDLRMGGVILSDTDTGDVDSLTEWVERRREEEKRKREHRHVLRILAVGVGTVAVFALVVWFVSTRRHEDVLTAHEDQLRSLVEQRKFADVVSFLETAERELPELLQRPVVQALISDNNSNWSEEQSRLTRVHELTTSLITKLESAATLDELNSLTPILDEAQNAAQLESERSRISSISQQLLARRTEIQDAIDQAFMVDFDAASKLVADTDGRDAQALRAIAPQLRALQERADVTAALKQPLAALISRVQSSISDTVMRQAQQSRLEQLTQAVGAPAQFQSQMEAYVREYPGTARALAFEEILKSDPAVWTGIHEWNRCADKWRFRNLRSLSQPEAEVVSGELHAMLSKYGTFPQAEGVRKLLPFVEAIQARGAGETSLKAALNNVLKNPVVQIRFMLLGSDEKRYYSNEAPTQVGSRWQGKFFTGLDLEESAFKAFDAGKLIDFGPAGKKEWKSPQLQLCDDVRGLLAANNDRAWEDVMLDVIAQLVESPHLDPVLKVILFQAIGDIARKGSLPLSEALAPAYQSITDSAIDTDVNYIGPDDADAQRVREQALNLLARFPTVESLRDQTATRLTEARSIELGPVYVWHGWLDAMEDGKWVIVSANKLRPNENDQVLVGGGDVEHGPVFVPIGRVSGGECRLSESAPASGCAVGRAVYCVTAAKGK